MELRDVLKRVRGELGMNQAELANALHVSFSSVSRWETGKTYPNRSALAALSEYAAAHSVSYECRSFLERAIEKARKAKIAPEKDKLFSVEHSSLSQLIDDASFPIYVCDLDTFELLFTNRMAEKLLGGTLAELKGRTCFDCLMHCTEPCPFCRREELTTDRFTSFQVVRPGENAYHIVQAKLVQWNGRRAQVRYIVDVGDMMNITDRGVNNTSLAQSVAEKLLKTEYETIVLIDAETGAATPYAGSRIYNIITEQRSCGDNSDGVEAYFRKHCDAGEVRRIVEGTSLSYVKGRLKSESCYYFTYKINEGGKRVLKRAVYTYLDDERRTLLGAVQNLGNAHAQSDAEVSNTL